MMSRGSVECQRGRGTGGVATWTETNERKGEQAVSARNKILYGIVSKTLHELSENSFIFNFRLKNEDGAEIAGY